MSPTERLSIRGRLYILFTYWAYIENDTMAVLTVGTTASSEVIYETSADVKLKYPEESGFRMTECDTLLPLMTGSRVKL